MALDNEARRRGGQARAKQFTSESQAAASAAQKTKHKDKLALWGRLGYRAAARAAGFTNTFYARSTGSGPVEGTEDIPF